MGFYDYMMDLDDVCAFVSYKAPLTDKYLEKFSLKLIGLFCISHIYYD